jgi:hypothetical protein
MLLSGLWTLRVTFPLASMPELFKKSRQNCGEPRIHAKGRE